MRSATTSRKASKGFIDFLLLERKGFPVHRPGSEGGGQKPARRQRAGAQIRAGRRIAASSSSRTATCIISGTSSAAIPTSSPRFPRRVRDGLSEDRPRPEAAHRRERSATTTSSSRSGPATRPKRRGKTKRSAPRFIEVNGLRFLRPYQKKSDSPPSSRPSRRAATAFFSRWRPAPAKRSPPRRSSSSFSAPATRTACLFLVDRLELEDQALKAFTKVLANDYKTVIYKENRDDWRQGGDRRHHRSVAALQQQIPAALFAHGFRPGDLGRSAPLHRRQCPRRLRLLHRLQAGPHRHAARLPEEIRQDEADNARPARVRAPAAARYLSHFRLRRRPADLPLLAARWRQGRLPHQSHRRRCPQRHHHAAAFRGGLRRRVQGRGRRGSEGSLQAARV